MSPAPDLNRLRVEYARAELLSVAARCKLAVSFISEEESEQLCAADLFVEARRLRRLASEAAERLALAEGRPL